MGKRRTTGRKTKDVSTSGKSSTPAATPKSQRLRSSARKQSSVADAVTPLRLQNFLSDDGSFPLSQNADVCDVTWQSTSPITFTQATRDSRNKRKSKADISELVRKFSQGASSPTSTITSSPLVGCWVTTQAASSSITGSAFRGRKRGRPSGIKTAVNSRDILQKLTSVFDNKIEEEPNDEQHKEDVTRSADSHPHPLEEPRPQSPGMCVSEPAVTSVPPLPVPSAAPSAAMSTPTPPSVIPPQKTPKNNPPAAANQSCEELWTDEELFDDSLILQATQELFDSAPEDTPKAPKRTRTGNSPKPSRFTFSLKASNAANKPDAVKPPAVAPSTNPALSHNSFGTRSAVPGKIGMNSATFKPQPVSSVPNSGLIHATTTNNYSNTGVPVKAGSTAAQPLGPRGSKPAADRNKPAMSSSSSVVRPHSTLIAPSSTLSTSTYSTSTALPPRSMSATVVSTATTKPATRSLTDNKPSSLTASKSISSPVRRRLQVEPPIPSSPVAGLGDTSISDDLLATLAAPDDLLDSQIVSEEAWLDEGDCVEAETMDIIFEENTIVDQGLTKHLDNQVKVKNQDNIVPQPVNPQKGPSAAKGASSEFSSDEDENLDTDQLLALLDHAESSQLPADESHEEFTATTNDPQGTMMSAVTSTTRSSVSHHGSSVTRSVSSHSHTTISAPIQKSHSFPTPTNHYGAVNKPAPTTIGGQPAVSKATSIAVAAVPLQKRGTVTVPCSPPERGHNVSITSCSMSEIERKRQEALRRRAKAPSPQKSKSASAATTVSSDKPSVGSSTGHSKWPSTGNRPAMQATLSHEATRAPSPTLSQQSSSSAFPSDIERKRHEALQRRAKANSDSAPAAAVSSANPSAGVSTGHNRWPGTGNRPAVPASLTHEPNRGPSPALSPQSSPSAPPSDIERKRQEALRLRAKVTSPWESDPASAATISSAKPSVVARPVMQDTVSLEPTRGPSPAASPQTSPTASPIDIERKRQEAMQRRLRSISPQKSNHQHQDSIQPAVENVSAHCKPSVVPHELSKENHASRAPIRSEPDRNLVKPANTLTATTSPTTDTTVSQQIELKKQEALKRRNSRLKLSTKNRK